MLDVLFSPPDGRLLATRAAAGTNGVSRYLGEAHLWDVATGREIAVLREGGWPLPGGIGCIAFSPDGRRLAAGAGRLTGEGIRCEVRLYDTATGKLVGRPLPVSPGKIPDRLAFGPDGRLLAMLSLVPDARASELAVWDVASGQEALPPVPLAGDPHGCVFSPGDGRLAVAAGTALQVWDPATGKVLYLPHPGEVTAVRYQQGGRVLLSTCERVTSHTIYLCDGTTGEILRPPVRHPYRVQSAALSADGRFLVAAGDPLLDREVRIWDLATDPARGAERGRLARLLSCQEVDGPTVVPVPVARLAADWEELHRTAPDLLAPTDDQVVQWHERQVSRLVAAEAWAAAARQCELLAARHKDRSDRTWWGYQACACSLAAGDRAALRRQAEELLRRNRESSNLYDVERTVKSCLIDPDAVPARTAALSLSRRLEKADPRSPNYPWFLATRGIALYRAGRPDAVAWLERARAARQRPPLCAALADFFLAMARIKDRPAEARQALAEGERLLDAVEKEPGNSAWFDRLHCRAALREAKAKVPAP